MLKEVTNGSETTRTRHNTELRMNPVGGIALFVLLISSQPVL
jgi:hypothetical protein